MKKILCLLFLLFLVGCNNNEYEIKYNDFQEYHKYYVKGIIQYDLAETNKYIANHNYNLYVSNYEDIKLNDAYTYCVAARDIFSLSNSEYQKSIAYFNKANKVANLKNKEIVENYIKISNISIEMNWNLYESCEYTESAINFYYQELYDLGDAEVKKSNEKVAAHDNLIVEYNKNLKELEVSLE